MNKFYKSQSCNHKILFSVIKRNKIHLNTYPDFIIVVILNTCFVYIDFIEERDYGERFIIFISNQPVLLREMKKLFESLWQTLQVGCFIINWEILRNFLLTRKACKRLKCWKLRDFLDLKKNHLKKCFNQQVPQFLVTAKSSQYHWSFNGRHSSSRSRWAILRGLR